jgi:hypothetical protein
MAPWNNEQLTMDGAATLLSDGTAPSGAERRDFMASPDTANLAHKLDLVTQERDMLRKALDDARTREQAALERDMLQLRVFEQAQKQLEGARERFEQAQKQLEGAREHVEKLAQQRLLETNPSPAERPTGWQHLMRERILALLEGEPAGLTRPEIEKALSTTKHLGDTLVGMARPGGRLVRIGKGRFALARSHDTTQA